MKTSNMNASLLEKLLIFIIILIIAAIFGIYYFLSNFARSQADSANQSLAEADSSQKDIENISTSYRWLKDNPEIVSKTNKIVAEASYYQYQDQVIGDLESYADQAELYISGYMFTDTSAATPGSTTGGSAPAASSTPTAPPATSSSTSGNNLKSATVQITFGKSIPFEKLIVFLKKIEQNVTRMQITNLTISPNPKSPSSIDVEMTVSVFLNK